MRIKPLILHTDFQNEDGTYDDGVLDIIKDYNEIVRKYNAKYSLLEEVKRIYKEMMESNASDYYKNLFNEKHVLFKDDKLYDDKYYERVEYQPSKDEKKCTCKKSFISEMEDKVAKQINEDRQLLGLPMIWTNKKLIGTTEYNPFADSEQFKENMRKSFEDFAKKYYGETEESQSNKVMENIDSSKIQAYDAEPYFKEPNISIIDFYFIDFSKTPFETIKQITPDIQHVITPSENYFLFKLSK